MTQLATFFGAVTPAVKSSSDHHSARSALMDAWTRRAGSPPTPAEIQAVQAIALHETGYGQFPPFPGSHNWGAIQVPGTWGATECPASGFLWRDSNPRPDGSDDVRTVCFRKYADDVNGAVAFVSELLRRPRTREALATGDADRIAGAMYAEHYFTGHGATPTERIAGYAKAIATRAQQIAAALHEPLLVRRGEATVRSDTAVLLPLAALLGLALVKSTIGAEPVMNAIPRGTPVFPDVSTGDLLPTIVTPEDARNYIDEIDAGYTRLDAEIQTSDVNQRFKQSWSVQLDGWRRFRDRAREHSSWINTKATMEQADRWASQLTDWHRQFTAAGGQPAGPAPSAPGQGTAPPPAGLGWTHVALLIAALFGAGYLLRGVRGV